MTPSKKEARRAGFFYLAFLITFIFADVFRSNLIVFGDASKTTDLINNSMLQFRISFIADIVSAVFFLLAAWGLYVLLKQVNKNLAMLFLLLNATGVAIQCLSLLFLFAPVLINSSTDLKNVFQPDQLNTLNMLFINLYKNGFMIAQIFYSTWLFPLGYLVYKSNFLPKWLGILLIADFFGVMIWFLQFFLIPGYEIITYPGLAISFIAEVSLCLWLLIIGVKEQKSIMNEVDVTTA